MKKLLYTLGLGFMISSALPCEAYCPLCHKIEAERAEEQAKNPQRPGYYDDEHKENIKYSDDQNISYNYNSVPSRAPVSLPSQTPGSGTTPAPTTTGTSNLPYTSTQLNREATRGQARSNLDMPSYDITPSVGSPALDYLPTNIPSSAGQARSNLDQIPSTPSSTIDYRQTNVPRSATQGDYYQRNDRPQSDTPRQLPGR